MNFGDPRSTGLHPRCNVSQILLKCPAEVPEGCSLPLVIDLEPLPKGTDDGIILSVKKCPNSPKFLLFFPEEHNSTQ